MSNGILKIGDYAPWFSCTSVVNGQFKEVSLSDYRGQFLVLLFYPFDFNFVCPTELVAFNDQLEDFSGHNCSIVACSPDHHFCHLLWTTMPRHQGGIGDIQFPIMSDMSKEISRAYGVLDEDLGVCYRALFIIDDNGIIRQITINDKTVGRSSRETLRLVQALRFYEDHGLVCPAGWKPGQMAIMPIPDSGSHMYKFA